MGRCMYVCTYGRVTHRCRADGEDVGEGRGRDRDRDREGGGEGGKEGWEGSNEEGQLGELSGKVKEKVWERE